MNLCRNTWQGPSDETCTDDLLTVECAEWIRHQDLHHGLHPDTKEPVMWVSSTSNLLRVSDGTILQRQFDKP